MFSAGTTHAAPVGVESVTSRIPASAFQTFDASNALASLGTLIANQLKKDLESGNFGGHLLVGDSGIALPQGPISKAIRSKVGSFLTSLLFAP
jgi:hypothetical protein